MSGFGYYSSINNTWEKEQMDSITRMEFLFFLMRNILYFNVFGDCVGDCVISATIFSQRGQWAGGTVFFPHLLVSTGKPVSSTAFQVLVSYADHALKERKDKAANIYLA